MNEIRFYLIIELRVLNFTIITGQLRLIKYDFSSDDKFPFIFNIMYFDITLIQILFLC